MLSPTFSMRLYPFLFCTLLLAATGCKEKGQADEPARNGAFAKAKETEGPNVQRIVDSGELIVATLSGPDTYFDYQGQPMGLQYALCEDFAATLGVAVRVVLATDTTQLIRYVQTGEADLAALPLPTALSQKSKLRTAGYVNEEKQLGWALRNNETDLAEALDNWYVEGLGQRLQQREQNRLQTRRTVKRQVHAPFISREKGIISTYDALFKVAAQQTGWDWRLIAAQCYQESGFDPNAVSWAGARGLMQIMPGTARHLSLPEEQVFQPKANMMAAARYIRELQGQFASIQDPEERAKFVLASYNGGLGHIQDAQALTRKHGGNPSRWADVGYYVKNLSNVRFYRDPVVRHGYMIGSETYDYVESIMNRWRQYGGNVSSFSSRTTPSTLLPDGTEHTRRPHKPNRFSKERRILSPEELKGENPENI